ncbi:MAG: DUF2249 domain-containing protein [Chloroflexi bacterium]|nr:DUF2249 domain-containing protein [Chloroflexota bacterium]
MAFLDVRPDLAAGHEPFGRIMAAVKGLAPGESLELVAPFEPVPLYQVMEARGFTHATRRTSDGSWHVTFQRLMSEE